MASNDGSRGLFAGADIYKSPKQHGKVREGNPSTPMVTSRGKSVTAKGVSGASNKGK